MSKEKKKETKKASQTLIVKGQLDISKGGLGFVIVEGVEKDIVVRPNDFNRALHGDTVKVQIKKDSGSGKRSEGVITEVVERKQSTFIGNMQVRNNVAFFMPASEKSIPDFYVPWEKLNGAADGQSYPCKPRRHQHLR